jgi:hypothetical protein
MNLTRNSPRRKSRTAFVLLTDSHLAAVSGGCRDCQTQLHAPSSLSAFAPSRHGGLGPLATTADYLQPPSYFNLL